MKLLIQRVSHADVLIDGGFTAAIGLGLVVFLGIASDDAKEDIDWLCQKLSCLRVFDDEQGVMNLDIKQVNGEVLLISQFTLMASTKKGNRPSYTQAARPEIALPLYETFIKTLEASLSKRIGTGVFGADMKVSLVNDGPVTISIDSKCRV